ncbi:MAG: lipoate--protein ligase [Pleomorphochaeta sp.]
MNRVYLSKEIDPYYNVATEYQLLTEATNDTFLFLWQNNPTVIFGRNQNIFAEADINYLKTNNILPVRRFSGGGAVFQDLGNLNFTFITKEKNSNIEKYLTVIKNAVSSFNIDCSFSGRNDLLSNGKKFSGHAYFTNDDNYLYHGTIMLDVNLDMLTKALTPSFLKLKSKGIDSVRSRVINLKQVNKEVDKEKMVNALFDSFLNEFGDVEKPIIIDKESFKAPMYNTIKNDQWIYDESPQYSITIEKKVFDGNVSVSVDVENGKIVNIKILSDSILIYNYDKCEKKLINTEFKEDIIFNYIEKFMQDKYNKKDY